MPRVLGTIRTYGVGIVSQIRTHTFDDGNQITRVKLTVPLYARDDGTIREQSHNVECRGNAAGVAAILDEGELVRFEGYLANRSFDRGGQTTWYVVTVGTITPIYVEDEPSSGEGAEDEEPPF